MLPSFAYVLAALGLLLLTLLLLPFRRGRRLWCASLPAVAFFALLLGTAEVAFRTGRQHADATAGAGPAGAVWTCSMHPQIRQPQPGRCPICQMELTLLPPGGDAGGGAARDAAPAVVIDPVVVQNMGVRVGAVTRAALVRTVRAPGTLREIPARRRDVALRFDGTLVDVVADSEGRTVAAGAPLASIRSPALWLAQQELIAARRSGDADLLQAARQRLLLWDFPAATVDALQARDEPLAAVPIPAPIAGTVVMTRLVAGTPVAEKDPLVRIVDLGQLWLDAQVAAGDLDALQPGQPAQVDVDGAAAPVAGAVVFVAPTIDAATRTGTVRVELDNEGGRLRPGQFARLRIAVTASAPALLVPLEAVLDTGRRQVVWLARGRGRFEMRPVRTGRLGDDGRIEVTGDLAVGDPVVLSGQLLIDAESRLRESTRKLDDDGLMPGGELPPPPMAVLSAAAQGGTDALLQACLRVGAALAADRLDGADWEALGASARALTGTLPVELEPLAGAVAAAVPPSPPTDLVAARVAFKAVSTAAIALFAPARPRATGAAQLYVQHCPMAAAEWLQLEATVHNPYYGSAMPACGEVRRTLPLRGAEGGK